MATPNDAAHMLAEESLQALEREYSRIYGQAAREMKAKHEKTLKKYQGELSQRLKALDESDPEAVKRHETWLTEQAMTQQWIGGMSDELSARATHANVLAMDALHDRTPRVYAENANWAAYDIDRKIGYDTTFTLVDEDTVRNLVMNGGSTEAVGSAYKLAGGMTSTAGGRLLPEITLSLKERMFPHVDETRDYIWNRRRFHTAITQGIIQGESIPNIVKRLEGIFGSNRAAATRAARTATTCAENAGRISSYQRAQDMGIKLKQEWLAALDSRTRSSHRMLDGQKVEIGGKFQAERGELRFPGDPLGHPAETYNCRCTLVADVDGVEQEDAERWSRLPKGMTYEEWKAGKSGTAVKSNRFDFAAYTPGTPLESMAAIIESMPQSMKEGRVQDYDYGNISEAEYAVRTMQRYTTSQWERYRYDGYLDKAIRETSEHFDGPMFRGMQLRKSQIDSIQVGGTMKPNGVQSWSREHGKALDYCEMRRDGGEAVLIVDVTDGRHTAISIEAVSQYEMEREVLSSASIEYEVTAKYEQEFEHFSLRTFEDKLRATVIEVRERRR